jgi:transposase
MSQTRKTYTREFKLETLRLAETSGKTVAEVERDLGLPKGAIHHWRQQLARDGVQAFPGHGRLREADEQVRRLERENTILRQERDILKKALSVFSRSPK